MTHEREIQLGMAKVRAGQLAEAEAIFRGIVAQEPSHPEANVNIGNLLCMAEKPREALESYQRALAGRPRYSDAHINIGNAYKAMKDYDRAIVAYKTALSISPGNATAVGNLGTVLQAKWLMDEAIDCYRRVIAIRPDYAMAHYNLGTALELLGQLAEAIAEYRRAVELDPKSAAAYSSLAGALVSDGQFDEALAAGRRAIVLQPDFAKAHVNLGTALWLTGSVAEAAESFRRGAALAPDAPEYLSSYLYMAHFVPRMDGPTIRREHDAWNREFGEPLRAAIPAHSNERAAERRLRIGYVSPNFRSHAEAAFILPLLEQHDHERFEVFCYSDSLTADAVTTRMRIAADTWRLTRQLDAQKLAEMIREDRIDILIDLTLHMRDSRIMVFARKPAPVQVAYLAYPGTTGLTTMDYRLTDSYLDPPGEHDEFYSETLIRLPRTFACYDPAGMQGKPSAPMPEPGTSPPVVLNGFVTFGCLNNFAKVNDGVLELWSGVMRSVPGARLRLLAPTESGRRRVRARLRELGMDEGRIDFVGKQNRPEYLAEYLRIDICLDTLPYNGHTTSLDSIWMGVPVVTLLGRTAAGRVGWSVANNLRLTELAAHSEEEFVQIAVGLAADVTRLTDMRRTLRERLLASPIMDAAGFTREVEAAYREMWKRWVVG